MMVMLKKRRNIKIINLKHASKFKAKKLKGKIGNFFKSNLEKWIDCRFLIIKKNLYLKYVFFRFIKFVNIALIIRLK